MHWENVEVLINELGLKESIKNPHALRRELVLKIGKLHPDNIGSGGSFKTDADEEEYGKLVRARDFIDSKLQEANALIPIDKLPAIIEALSKAQLAPVESRIASLREEARSDARAKLRNKLMFPRISSGVFAVVAGFAATFSNNFQSDPVFGYIVALPTFRLLMFLLTLSSAMLFISTWITEKKEEMRLDMAMSELGRRQIFEGLIRQLAQTERTTITLSNVITEVQSYYRRPSPLGTLAAEKVARSLILELEDRGVIERTNKAGFDVVYQISDFMMSELRTRDA